MITVHNLEIGVSATLLARLDEKALTSGIKDIADAAWAEWKRLAGSVLHTTRQTYVAGLQPVAMAPGMATISLVGALPNVIENGMPQTDMRDTLLGPNAIGKHKSKDGFYYRAIPFRHATPTDAPSQGQNVGTPMGKSYQGMVADSRKLGRDVYRKASTLKASIGEPHTQTKWGERLAERTAGTPKLKEHHATDIYAGMVKLEKVYKQPGKPQSQYMTFRTISEKVQNGWIRGATEGKHLAEQVAHYIEEIGPATFVAYVEGLTATSEGPPPGAPK